MRLIAPARARARSRMPAGAAAPVACAVALAWLALGAGAPAAAASAQTRAPGTSNSKPGISATLVQCVTAVSQAERSATFSGEMMAVSGTTHMEMRIDVLERLPEESFFHVVSAPGLGIWRGSSPGVKVYRYLKQVTNLSAPAYYRAAVRFRWLNAKGRLIRSEELRTPRCQQPAPPVPLVPPATVTASSVSPAPSGG